MTSTTRFWAPFAVGFAATAAAMLLPGARAETHSTLVGSGYIEAGEATDELWSLANDPAAPWEAVYPIPGRAGPTDLTGIAN